VLDAHDLHVLTEREPRIARGEPAPVRRALGRHPNPQCVFDGENDERRSSIATNNGPYWACNAGTESSVIVTRFVTIRTTMSRPRMRPVRSPLVPCSRI
jgi:hypothetical protein